MQVKHKFIAYSYMKSIFQKNHKKIKKKSKNFIKNAKNSEKKSTVFCYLKQKHTKMVFQAETMKKSQTYLFTIIK